MNKQNKLLLWYVHRLEMQRMPRHCSLSRKPPWKTYLFISYYREQVEIHKGIWEAGGRLPATVTYSEWNLFYSCPPESASETHY